MRAMLGRALAAVACVSGGGAAAFENRTIVSDSTYELVTFTWERFCEGEPKIVTDRLRRGTNLYVTSQNIFVYLQDAGGVVFANRDGVQVKTQPAAFAACGRSKIGLRKDGNRLRIRKEDTCKGGGNTTFTSYVEWDYAYGAESCRLTFRDWASPAKKSCGARVSEIAMTPPTNTCKVVEGRQAL